MMVMDIKRAFVYGATEEKIFIDVPDEDPKKSGRYMRQLLKAMYGTKAAPVVWQRFVKATKEKLGFVSSRKYPCVYHERIKNIKVVTHVDDFLSSSFAKDMRWLQAELNKAFEAGPGPQEGKVPWQED